MTKKAKNRIATSALALLASMYAPKANADIRLSEVIPQTTYSIVEDATTEGYDIRCNIKWRNSSTAVPANNQISANGLFGEVDAGLYNISTTDSNHFFDPPTYTLSPTTFNIDYADGVVNTPGNTDTFEFRFNLGTTNEATANAVVEELNDLVLGIIQIADSQYGLERSINGQVTDNGIIPKPFENSPTIYVPNSQTVPEATTSSSLIIGMGLLFGYRRVTRKFGMR